MTARARFFSTEQEYWVSLTDDPEALDALLVVRTERQPGNLVVTTYRAQYFTEPESLLGMFPSEAEAIAWLELQAAGAVQA